MAVAFGDELRAVVVFAMPEGSVAQNIFYWEASVGVNDGDANVVTAIRDQLLAAYAELHGQIVDDVQGSEVIVYKRDSGSGLWVQIGSASFAAFAPTNSGDMIPHGVAPLVQFAGDGVSFSKRTYIAGIAEALVLRSILTQALIDALLAFAASILENITVAGGDLEGGWWSEARQNFEEFSGEAIVNGSVAYQRRRKPGVGI